MVDKLVKEGWRAWRAYASKGIWDVIAMRKKEVMTADYKTITLTEVVEIQVKGTPYEFKDEDKLALKMHAEEIGGKAWYVYRDRRGKTKNGTKRVKGVKVYEYL